MASVHTNLIYFILINIFIVISPTWTFIMCTPCKKSAICLLQIYQSTFKYRKHACRGKRHAPIETLNVFITYGGGLSNGPSRVEFNGGVILVYFFFKQLIYFYKKLCKTSCWDL